MSKVTVICGSSNQNGFSYHISNRIFSQCQYLKLDCSLFHPSKMRIAHCSGCNQCKNGICSIDDDMKEILDSVSESELVFLLMPIHFSGPSSLIKTVMDRFQPCWFNELGFRGKICTIMCAGGKKPCYSYSEGIVRAFSITTGMEINSFLQISNTDELEPEWTDDLVDDYIDPLLKNLVG